jgi:hypothetical protein
MMRRGGRIAEGGKAGESQSAAEDAGSEDADNAAGVAVFSGPAGYFEEQIDAACGVRRYEAEKAHTTAPV